MLPYVTAAAVVIGLLGGWVFLFRRVLKHPNLDNDYHSTSAPF